ncbi:MAG TPA: hypothetical protein VHF22_02495, partial [Planctomycetota bacterium]|nr:hypothetical protein [Planctomycetota bacterium]
LIALYAAESTYARAYDSLTSGAAGENAAAVEAIAKLAIHDACREIREKGLEILTDLTPPARLEEELATFRKLTGAFAAHVDTFKLKRLIADRAIELGKYAF